MQITKKIYPQLAVVLALSSPIYGSYSENHDDYLKLTARSSPSADPKDAVINIPPVEKKPLGTRGGGHKKYLPGTLKIGLDNFKNDLNEEVTPTHQSYLPPALKIKRANSLPQISQEESKSEGAIEGVSYAAIPPKITRSQSLEGDLHNSHKVTETIVTTMTKTVTREEEDLRYIEDLKRQAQREVEEARINAAKEVEKKKIESYAKREVRYIKYIEMLQYLNYLREAASVGILVYVGIAQTDYAYKVNYFVNVGTASLAGVIYSSRTYLVRKIKSIQKKLGQDGSTESIDGTDLPDSPV